MSSIDIDTNTFRNSILKSLRELGADLGSEDTHPIVEAFDMAVAVLSKRIDEQDQTIGELDQTIGEHQY